MSQDSIVSDTSIRTQPQASQIKANLERNYRLLLVSILGGYLLLQAALMPHLYLTYQEGINLQVSGLMNLGHQPYTQIFVLDPPLFVWVLGWLGQFGLSPAGFKWVFLLFGLLLLVNMATIAKTLLGKTAALATVFLLASTPTFLSETATGIIAVLPALSLATLSLALTLRCFTNSRWLWLLAGGLLWGTSLFFSLSVWSVGLIAPGFLVFLSRRTASAQNRGWRLPAIWGSGALVALIFGIIVSIPDVLFNELFKNYVTIFTTLAASQQDNFRLIGRFLTFNIWLFLLAGYGLVRLSQRASHPLWLFLVWLLLNLGWLMLQPVLTFAAMAILLPPLAVLAGWGLVQLVRRVAQLGFYPQPRWAWVALGVVIIGLYGLGGWQRFNAFMLRAVDTDDDLTQIQQRVTVAQFVQQHTSASNCVIIDDAALAVAAGRLPPPQLTNLLPVQTVAGFVAEKNLTFLLDEYNCQAVVLSKREYYWHLTQFREEVSKHYPHEETFIRTKVYYR